MEQKPKRTWRMGLKRVLSGAGIMSFFMALCLLAVQNYAPGEVQSAMLELPSERDGPRMLIPVGRAVGIKLFSDGVLVVGLTPVETEGGAHCPGRECGLKEGDLITHVNGAEVDTVEEIRQAVADRPGEELSIQAMRGRKQLQLTAAPIQNEAGVFQLGVWLRDSMAGVGTMTFCDPETGAFGALGHGINDVDTSILMPLEKGGIMEASISDVKRGEAGDPGELHGTFDMTEDMGRLTANTRRGVFGVLSGDRAGTLGQAIPAANRNEIHTGPAQIRSNVRGRETESFDVKITRVTFDGDGTRNLALEVTDPKLLSLTGGIVQGMSGSPIIQDGKLVGAVTHVLVNDPTRGYGIFIENMLEAAE